MKGFLDVIAVRCLGVWIDDGLTWREQIEAVRKKCFMGLAKLKRLRNILPTCTKKKIYCALVQPHLDYCSVLWQECSKVLQKKLDRIQGYGMRLILSQPPRTPSAGLRKTLNWMPLGDRRELFRLGLVHQCVREQSPRCLRERFRTIGEVGRPGTQGSRNLFLPSVNTEFLRRSLTFRGAWDWNRLPVSVRELGSEAFRRRLKARILDRL